MLHSQAVETLYKAMLARLEVRVLEGRRERGENGCYHLLTHYNMDFFFLQPLCLDLARSTEEVVEVGSEVEKLRERLRRVQEEKEEEEEVEGEEEMVIGNLGADGEQRESRLSVYCL